MQATLTSKVTINAVATQVFTYLSDLKYHHLWNPHLQTITPQTVVEKGTEYHTSSIFLGIRIKNQNTISVCRPPKLLIIESGTGTLRYKVSYELIHEAGQTTVICTTHVKATGKAFAFTQPVLTVLARRELQADLKSLKIAVEHRLK